MNKLTALTLIGFAALASVVGCSSAPEKKEDIEDMIMNYTPPSSGEAPAEEETPSDEEDLSDEEEINDETDS